MDERELKAVIEALLFISGEPLSVDRIKNVLEEEEVDRGKIKALLWEIQNDYDLRLSGLKIAEIAGGFQIVTRPEYSGWIRKLKKVKQTARLTLPSLETLAIIAYKQPIVKAEIEDIRGVDSSGVIKGLLDKHMIKIMGRKDVPGRPILYATTKEFLQYFGLKDLGELPTLKEFNDLVMQQGGEGPVDVNSEEGTEESNAATVSQL